MTQELSASQIEKVRLIEKITSACVVFEPRLFDSDPFEVWLRLPLEEITDDEEEDDALAYIADQPRRDSMSEGDIAKYPEYLQGYFLNLPAEETCNVVLSVHWNHSIDELLDEMRMQTELLRLGWHLGRECDLNDPFTPPLPPPKSEEELLWEECNISKDSKLESNDYIWR